MEKQEALEDGEEKRVIFKIYTQLQKLSTRGIKKVINHCNELLAYNADYLVPHPEDERFTFPLPSGVDDPVPWRNLAQPPFFNRQLALLSLLNDCFANFTRIGSTKPKAAVLTTAPGYGKTRLLLEWAIRVFHNAEVLQAFIENKSLPLENTKELKTILNEIESGSETLQDRSERTKRIRFLVNLHRTLQQSVVLSISGLKLDFQLRDPNSAEDVAKATDLICRSIVSRNICRRFHGRTVGSKEMMIPNVWNVECNEDKTWLESAGLLKAAEQPKYTVFFSLMRLFIHLVEKEGYTPIGQPLPGTLILVNIDEAQGILAQEALQKAVAYHVLIQFYEFAQESKVFKVHVLMVGLYGADLSKLQDPTRILTDVILPLNPLSSEEYYQKVCKNVSAAGSRLVDILWRRCLGIPRAVQILHDALQSFEGILARETITTAEQKQLFDTFTRNATSYFIQRGLAGQFDKQVLLELSLCLTNPQNGIVRGATTYAELEGKGIILPIQFGPVKGQCASRSYTLPFHFYGSEIMNISAELWKGDKPSELFDSYSPILADIVGGDGSETSTEGSRLEVACATSLWARYQLQAKNQYTYVKMQSLVADWKYSNHYVRLTGVFKAKCQISEVIDKVTKSKQAESRTFAALLPSLKESQAIIINKANLNFADVLVPVLMLENDDLNKLQTLANKVEKNEAPIQALHQQESDFIRFLLIQCKSVQAKCEDVRHMTPLLDQGHIFVLVDPKPSNQSTKQDVTDQQNFVESNGSNWLSMLFLLSYLSKITDTNANSDMLADENKPIPIAAKGSKKRKAKKDINPAKPKKTHTEKN